MTGWRFLWKEPPRCGAGGDLPPCDRALPGPFLVSQVGAALLAPEKERRVRETDGGRRSYLSGQRAGTIFSVPGWRPCRDVPSLELVRESAIPAQSRVCAQSSLRVHARRNRQRCRRGRASPPALVTRPTLLTPFL